jgi:hypothetical protein
MGNVNEWKKNCVLKKNMRHYTSNVIGKKTREDKHTGLGDT